MAKLNNSIFIIIFSILSNSIFSQIHRDKYIDSLFKLSEYYGTNKIDSCKYIGNQIITYSRQKKDYEGIALGYFCLSRHMDRLGDYASAAEFAYIGIQSLDSSKSNQNKYIRLKLTNQQAINYRLIGLPDIALELHSEALNFAKKFQLTGYDVDILNVHLANLYLDFKNTQKVRDFCNLIVDTIPTIENTNMLAARNNALSRIELESGNYQNAIQLNRNTVEFCTKFNNLFFKCASYTILGSIYFRKNQIDSAVYYSKKALNLALENQYQRHINSSCQTLINFYTKTENKDSILKFMIIQSKASNFLYGKDNITQLISMNNSSKLKEKDTVIKLGREKSRNSILLLSLILSFASLGLFFMNYRSRQKTKYSKLLEEQYKNIESKNNELESTLSQLKSTQAQLIQSEKMASLGELTAGIAHEIQNPLNFVNNFSELSVDLAKELKEEALKASIDKQLIIDLATDLSQNQEKIYHHGKRASDIVKGMLEHSRKSSGNKEETDINALCDEYMRLAYHGYKAKDKSFNAAYEINLDPDLPKISVIPQDIGRVILNILNNAFYAVHERSKIVSEKSEIENGYIPKVSITTRKEESNIVIEIKDNGVGIPAHIKDKIFQPFFTTKPTGQGTGLGLSLSYDIIKAHGGNLEVESLEGEGITFKIQIPFIAM